MPAHLSSEVGRDPGGAFEAAGNAPGPTGEVPPAIRETSASTSLRPPLATSCSCSCSVAKSSPVVLPAPTQGSDAGGVGDAPTAAGGPTSLPLTCMPPVSCSCSCSVAKSSPVAAPAPTEGSDAGGDATHPLPPAVRLRSRLHVCHLSPPPLEPRREYPRGGKMSPQPPT